MLFRSTLRSSFSPFCPPPFPPRARPAPVPRLLSDPHLTLPCTRPGPGPQLHFPPGRARHPRLAQRPLLGPRPRRAHPPPRRPILAARTPPRPPPVSARPWPSRQPSTLDPFPPHPLPRSPLCGRPGRVRVVPPVSRPVGWHPPPTPYAPLQTPPPPPPPVVPASRAAGPSPPAPAHAVRRGEGGLDAPRNANSCAAPRRPRLPRGLPSGGFIRVDSDPGSTGPVSVTGKPRARRDALSPSAAASEFLPRARLMLARRRLARAVSTTHRAPLRLAAARSGLLPAGYL